MRIMMSCMLVLTLGGVTSEAQAPVVRPEAVPILSSGASARRVHRVWVAGTWIRVGGIPADSLVGPMLIKAVAERILLYDYGDHRLKAFTTDGHLLWSVGKRGGSWEFSNVMDLQIAPTGEVWIADPGKTRIEVIRADGVPARMIQTEERIARVLPLSVGTFLGLPENKPFFSVYDSNGHRFA